jgi:hypothetical protein
MSDPGNLAGAKRGESGSAYIAALLALVVLSILGLSLIFVTQTELELGSNERTINRTFYAADSGLAVAAARVLTTRAYEPFSYIQNRIRIGDQVVADRVEVTLAAPIAKAPCDWCPVNDDGVPKFYKVNHALTATASRVGWDSSLASPPADAKVYSRSELAVMFEFQPWRNPPTEAVGTPDQLRKIKF